MCFVRPLRPSPGSAPSIVRAVAAANARVCDAEPLVGPTTSHDVPQVRLDEAAVRPMSLTQVLQRLGGLQVLNIVRQRSGVQSACEAARWRALVGGILVHSLLELIPVGACGQTLVPLRMLVNSCGHSPLHLVPTSLALDRCVARLRFEYRLWRRLPRGANVHGGRHRAVVAAAVAESLCCDHGGARDIAEDVVHATKGVPIEDLCQVRPKALDRPRPSVRIEVTHEHQEVARLPVLRHGVQQVAGCGTAPADAAGVHGQRAMVVEEEKSPAGRQVLQAHPLHPPLAVELCPHVFSDILLALRYQSPRLLVVGHADRVVALEGLVVVQQTHWTQQGFRVFALLETHDVKGLWLHVRLDEPPGAVAPTMLDLEQMPPEEVVGQHLDLNGRPLGGRLPDGRRRLLLAPKRLGRNAAGPRALRVRGVVGLELQLSYGAVGIQAGIPVGVLHEASVDDPLNGAPAWTSVALRHVVATFPSGAHLVGPL
mmetsp:Transcript_22062/g.66284  ORF Transcript_22062/g.66284 Transcript_22062/m.66284 type:complete len:484 (+) Transcript_22062:246-1697(+)